MAKDGQISSSSLPEAENLGQPESPGPFGSLIELAFKLKNVNFRLLQKFGDKAEESCPESSCIIFQRSVGFSRKYKDQQYGKSCEDDALVKYGKTFQDSSDKFAARRSYITSSDFKLPLLPEPNKLIKSGFRYDSCSGRKILSRQRKAKSFLARPHLAVPENQLKLSCENPSTRKSRRLRRCHEDRKRAYNCPLCLYQTDDRWHLRRHQSSVHDADKAFYCYICKKEFSRSERVKAHFLNIHPEATYYSKMARKDLFDDEKDSDVEAGELVTDSFNAVPMQMVVNEAVHCVQSTGDRNDAPAKRSWERYCRIASQPFVNQQIFCCQVCSFSGSDIWLMKKHYLNVHLGATTYICRICRYSSSCMTRLVSHMLGHGELICFHCSYSTTEVKLFEKHLTVCSSLVRCSTCGMGFVSKDQLQSHSIEEHQSVLLCCDRCSFTSSSYDELSLHEGLHAVTNSSLVQEIESDDEALLGPYRSRSDVSTGFPSRMLKQHQQSSTGATCDDAVMNSVGEDISNMMSNTPSGVFDSIDDSATTATTPRLASPIYECLFPDCGFKASWKKSLELHTENYHSISIDHFKDDRSWVSCTWPQSFDCPSSGFFPCPFCPNCRTFKYRKSFEKHLAQHGLDHNKYPYLLAGLNLKGEVLSNTLMGNQ